MEFVLLPLAIVLLFYFILLRPQLNAQKKHRSNIANLEVGDEVLTAGGFFAIVVDIETQENGPPVIVFEVAPGVELEGIPAAIAEVNPRGRPEDGARRRPRGRRVARGVERRRAGANRGG